MATITMISESVGANRIVPTVAIPYPVGDPTQSEEDEEELREDMVGRAVKSLATDIDEPTHFS